MDITIRGIRDSTEPKKREVEHALMNTLILVYKGETDGVTITFEEEW
jgi:hypothetical protein